MGHRFLAKEVLLSMELIPCESVLLGFSLGDRGLPNSGYTAEGVLACFIFGFSSVFDHIECHSSCEEVIVGLSAAN